LKLKRKIGKKGNIKVGGKTIMRKQEIKLRGLKKN
jgi:hypothetical protein